MVPGRPEDYTAEAARCDPEHLFCSCVLVREAWLYVRPLVTRHRPDLQGEEDCWMIRFLFPKDLMDSKVVWVIANNLDIVHKQSIGRGARLLQPAVRGELAECLGVNHGRVVGV